MFSRKHCKWIPSNEKQFIITINKQILIFKESPNSIRNFIRIGTDKRFWGIKQSSSVKIKPVYNHNLTEKHHRLKINNNNKERKNGSNSLLDIFFVRPHFRIRPSMAAQTQQPTSARSSWCSGSRLTSLFEHLSLGSILPRGCQTIRRCLQSSSRYGTSSGSQQLRRHQEGLLQPEAVRPARHFHVQIFQPR